MTKSEANSNVITSLSDNRLKALKLNDSGLKKYLKVDFDDAIDDYTKALELDPNLAVAYYNRGTILYRLGNYGEALLDLEKAVRLDSENEEFLKGLKDCREIYDSTNRLVAPL